MLSAEVIDEDELLGAFKITARFLAFERRICEKSTVLMINSLLQLFSEVSDVVKPPDRERLTLKVLLTEETELEVGPVTVHLPRVRRPLEILLQTEIHLLVNNSRVNPETTSADLDVGAICTFERRRQRKVLAEQFV